MGGGIGGDGGLGGNGVVGGAEPVLLQPVQALRQALQRGGLGMGRGGRGRISARLSPRGQQRHGTAHESQGEIASAHG